MTAKEIAKLCNVSTATVSNILNGKGKASEETVQRVMAVVQEMNYRPNPIAQGLRTRVSNTIGIIADDIAQFTTPDILEGIMEVCEDEGYKVLVENLRCYSRWGEKWYRGADDYQRVLKESIEDFSAVNVDGFIYVAGHTREIVGFIENINVPGVIAHSFSSAENSISVMLDDVGGGYDITRYLIEKGHTRIGFIGGRKDNMHTLRRLEGYQKALFERGILYNPQLVRFGNWERSGGYSCMKELENEDLTAIFCINDQMCGGVYDYLEEKGLIAGKDISVAGYDDMVIAQYFRPGLTTMAIDLKEIGRISARELIAVFNGAERIPSKKIFVPCKMIERKSVAKLL